MFTQPSGLLAETDKIAVNDRAFESPDAFDETFGVRARTTGL